MDWSPFDIVGLDAFRGLRNAATYRDDLRKEFAHFELRDSVEHAVAELLPTA
ncbi:hypothetical protein OHA77_23825 [Streptosporangium sp. NBC_01639]|uniref:hypothetical protein n=1 Tax=Streptosporangium sp. NBC_01639 TaxID=2975948 RepID=UPI00386E99B0|nr:hypothetical protein OHA77_23825 [Streptosporangium sp. NBC_01639]